MTADDDVHWLRDEVKRLEWLVKHHADIYVGACEDAATWQERAEKAEGNLNSVRDYCLDRARFEWDRNMIPQARVYADIHNRLDRYTGVAEEDQDSEHTAGDGDAGGVGDPGGNPGV